MQRKLHDDANNDGSSQQLITCVTLKGSMQLQDLCASSDIDRRKSPDMCTCMFLPDIHVNHT